MNEKNIRINATIAYCFLAPLFLFAKKGTPISHEFVQGHAKKATIQMLVGTLIFVTIFSVRKFLYINILGFLVYDIILGGFLCIFLLIQAISAYKAYKGIDAKNIIALNMDGNENPQSSSLSDEQKIQIIASFLPFIGIFIAQKNPLPEILTGRKIANFFVFLFIIASILLKNTLTTLHLIITLTHIAILASTAVLLFARNQFLHLKIYNYIPTYHQCEAHLATFFVMTKEFFAVAFGKKREKNYTEEYQKYKKIYSTPIAPQNTFWAHPALIGIPVLNLITIPSLFQQKYAEYHQNITEGIIASILFIFILFLGNSYYTLYLLAFSFVTLAAESRHNIHVRAPISSLFLWVIGFFLLIKHRFTKLKNSHTETIHQSSETKITTTESLNSTPQATMTENQNPK